MRWQVNNFHIPFSPEDRLAVYQRALMLIQKKQYRHLGLCYYIFTAEIVFFYYIPWPFNINNYPEIAKIQTLRKRLGFTHWWAPSNKEVRIKALQNAIAEVEAIIQQSKNNHYAE